ncbi:MAG: helix-hairpin-helix domain-containing protein [Candidatus Hodarchaeota archaeon]
MSLYKQYHIKGGSILKLFVDHREDPKVVKIAEEVAEELDAPFEILHLLQGDFVVANEHAVVVERKRMGDFITSIRSNRMWQQLLELMKTETILDYPVKRRLVVVHGTIMDYLTSLPYRTAGRDSSRIFASLMGAMMEIIYVYDTPIVLTENDDAFKAFLRILAKREAEHKNDKNPEARWYRRRISENLPIIDRKRFTLASIPLIGEKLAGNLLDEFDTIADVVMASLDDLVKVPGIGKKKAAKIHEVFHD